MSDLAREIEPFGWDLDQSQISALSKYCQSLWALNERINLTRHLDYASFVARDLVDTMQLSRFIAQGETVLDIGSGGGVPGLVLAILRPDLNISLTDSVQKKARALEQLAADAGLRVEVYGLRAETLLQDFRYDTAVARAVGPLDRILGWLRGHWDVLGRLLAIKGPRWRDEKKLAEKKGLLRGLTCQCVVEYEVPGLGWTSSILEVKRQ